MSVPTIVKGQYFDVAVDVTGLGLTGTGGTALTGYVYLCGLNARNLTHQINTSDEAVPDCGKPATVPWRVLNATSQQKDMSGTGLYNVDQAGLIRGIFGKTLPYRFIEAQPNATDADTKDALGAWQGNYKFTNWQEGATDGTNVTAQFTFASDGEVLWVAAADLD